MSQKLELRLLTQHSASLNTLAVSMLFVAEGHQFPLCLSCNTSPTILSGASSSKRRRCVSGVMSGFAAVVLSTIPNKHTFSTAALMPCTGCIATAAMSHRRFGAEWSHDDHPLAWLSPRSPPAAIPEAWYRASEPRRAFAARLLAQLLAAGSDALRPDVLPAICGALMRVEAAHVPNDSAQVDTLPFNNSVKHVLRSNPSTRLF